jgi:hypothetical protein
VRLILHGGNAACDDAGMLMAVSLAGRGNRQATTWVTYILAASATGGPRCSVTSSRLVI